MTYTLRYPLTGDAEGHRGLAEVLAGHRAALRQAAPELPTDALDSVLLRVGREVDRLLRVEAERAAEEAKWEARRQLADELNQAARRLQQAVSHEEIGVWLVGASAPFCDRSAVLAVSGDYLQGLALRGIESEPQRAIFDSFDIPLPEAAAVEQCVRTGEPVVAIGSKGQVSPLLHELFRHAPGEKVCLLPVMVAGETAAVLYATEGERAVEMAPLELLAGLAGSTAEALLTGRSPRRSPDGEATAEETGESDGTSLVQIDGVASALASTPASTQGLGWMTRPFVVPEWSGLAGEDREFHRRARRFARVHVAEIRLNHADEVKAAVKARNVYGALREPIDEARELFRRQFLTASPTMVDYLHLEMVRSLARDNGVLLGKDYPGPMGAEGAPAGV